MGACERVADKRIGKTVRIRRGPAAVTGDESRVSHCVALIIFEMPREGAVSRTIRKPEDLPRCRRNVSTFEDQGRLCMRFCQEVASTLAHEPLSSLGR